ncbi:MAG: thiamine pyrophosphate-dependent enzyme [Spirochaetes bacterium]|jgi:2-oxoglutarate ferredoxin oxidoreductase subunit beta|nr:thiamine pyrophosphate-dependent enzyme [Spirochaetota bacterium]
MKKIYSRPKSLHSVPFHYCPGCGHSIIFRIIAELLDEMDLQEIAICTPPPGCSVLAYNYLNIDMVEAPHGRGAAVATGIKRVVPECLVFTYQGDGDLAAIGLAETMHAANRGENITAIFVNNAVYAMTGGQMAPTTLAGMKTSTSPYGRNPKTEGQPIKVSELLSSLDGVTYVERVAVNNPANIKNAKRATKKAFENQLNKNGFSIVEYLSMCPTNWKMGTMDSCKWIDEVMMKIFPLGVFKEVKC